MYMYLDIYMYIYMHMSPRTLPNTARKAKFPILRQVRKKQFLLYIFLDSGKRTVKIALSWYRKFNCEKYRYPWYHGPMNSMVQWTNVTSGNGYLGSADCHVQLSTNIHTIPRCHAHIRQRENEEAPRKKQSQTHRDILDTQYKYM